MGIGLLFMAITAVWWVVLGAIISNSAKKNLNLGFIQGGGAILTMILTFPLYFIADINIPLAVLIALPVSGFTNYYAFQAMNNAMKTGPNGMIWAMVQSAFVMPFLMGVIFFGVPCSVTRIIGLLIILASMVLMGLFGQSNQTAGGKKYVWIAITVAAYVLAGVTQCAANIPSYLIPQSSGTSLCDLFFRVGLNSSGFFLAYLVNCATDRKVCNCKGCIPGALLMTITTVLSMFCTFVGLDRLAKCNAGAIGYPVTVGLSIVFFMIYTAIRLKEKISFAAAFSILVCLAGIAVISL